MNTFVKTIDDFRFEASKVYFREDAICVVLVDGRELIVPLSFYPFLSQADEKDREKFELFGKGGSTYFSELDEYISVTNMVLGLPSFK